MLDKFVNLRASDSQEKWFYTPSPRSNLGLAVASSLYYYIETVTYTVSPKHNVTLKLKFTKK